MNYHKLILYAFKRFSVLRALHTGLPTAGYYLQKKPLEKNEKPVLCTMNVMPPLMTVWHHFAKKNLGDRADIVIFDCSGALNPRDFPGARVQKFLNFYAATKCNEFLYHIAKRRKIGWICDDDVFIVSPDALNVVEESLSKPNTASLSFAPRPGWGFMIDGTEYEASSSYCTAIHREIFCEKEHLSLSPADGNVHNRDRNGKPRRYDTFDHANEILLTKGYECPVVPKEDRSKYCAVLHGVSNAAMLLWYFKNTNQTIEYFTAPDPKKWGGNILYRAFAGMLTISYIQDLAEKISGKCYPLPSLPSKDELQQIRVIGEPLLREGHSFTTVDAVATRLESLL